MSILPETSKPLSRGFTLVETMVALVVLTMAIIPILYLTNSAVNVSATIRDDLIAAGLSQEGIEVARAIRDTNWFNGRAFDTGLSDGDYRVVWDSSSLIPAGANPPLLLASTPSSNGLYNYNQGTTSPFRRLITVAKINNAELKITSTVTWTTRTNAAKTVSAEDHLFDWK